MIFLKILSHLIALQGGSSCQFLVAVPPNNPEREEATRQSVAPPALSSHTAQRELEGKEQMRRNILRENGMKGRGNQRAWSCGWFRQGAGWLELLVVLGCVGGYCE